MAWNSDSAISTFPQLIAAPTALSRANGFLPSDTRLSVSNNILDTGWKKYRKILKVHIHGHQQHLNHMIQWCQYMGQVSNGKGLAFETGWIEYRLTNCPFYSKHSVWYHQPILPQLPMLWRNILSPSSAYPESLVSSYTIMCVTTQNHNLNLLLSEQVD